MKKIPVPVPTRQNGPGLGNLYLYLFQSWIRIPGGQLWLQPGVGHCLLHPGNQVISIDTPLFCVLADQISLILKQCFGSGSARIRIKKCLLDPDPDPGGKKA